MLVLTFLEFSHMETDQNDTEGVCKRILWTILLKSDVSPKYDRSRPYCTPPPPQWHAKVYVMIDDWASI